MAFTARLTVVFWPVRIPAWLDPFWHLDYEAETRMSTDAAGAALRGKTGRLRGRASGNGVTLVFRRGGLMNGFVRARVAVSPVGVRSKIRVSIARPGFASWSFVFVFIFVVAIPFLDLLEVAAVDRQRLFQAAVYTLLGAVIWVIVIAMNYTSARSEARDLRRLINQTLNVPS